MAENEKQQVRGQGVTLDILVSIMYILYMFMLCMKKSKKISTRFQFGILNITKEEKCANMFYLIFIM